MCPRPSPAYPVIVIGVPIIHTPAPLLRRPFCLRERTAFSSACSCCVVLCLVPLFPCVPPHPFGRSPTRVVRPGGLERSRSSWDLMCYSGATSGIAHRVPLPQTAFSGCASRRVLYPLLPSSVPRARIAQHRTKAVRGGLMPGCAPRQRWLPYKN